jgi:hypothetical protein
MEIGNAALDYQARLAVMESARRSSRATTRKPQVPVDDVVDFSGEMLRVIRDTRLASSPLLAERPASSDVEK